MERFFDSKIKIIKIEEEKSVARVKFSGSLTQYNMVIINQNEETLQLRHQCKLYDNGNDYFLPKTECNSWVTYYAKGR